MESYAFRTQTAVEPPAFIPAPAKIDRKYHVNGQAEYFKVGSLQW